MTEQLIQRARNLLVFKTERGAAAILVNNGVDPADAWLAIRAAAILLRPWEER